jgi:polysaccharide biosynthesis transport protein
MVHRIQILPALRARWRFALLIWMVAVAAALTATLLLPQPYEATASLVVELNNSDPMRGQEILKPAGTVSTYLATQVEVIRSEAVALAALRRLGLDKQQSLQDQWREETEGRGSFESWLAAKLLRKLAVLPSRDSNVVTLSYTSPDPDLSAAVANAFVQAYIDTSLQMRAVPARKFNTFFEERAKSLRNTLDEAKARLSAYEQKNGLIVSDPQEPDVESSRLAELTSQLVALQDEATAAADRQRQAVGSASGMQEVRNDPEVAELTSNLAKAEGELSRLKSQFGDRHPAVIEARKSIEDVRGRLSAATRRAASTLTVPVKANEARLAKVRKEIEQQRALVLARRSQRNAAAALLRDVDNAQKAYDAVLQRESQTALEAANTTQPNISVVKSATPPAQASTLFLMINLVVAMLLAPLLGAAGAVLRESRDRRLRTVEDVTGLLRQPLLLALPDGLARRRETARRSFETQRRLVSAQPRLSAPR